MAEIEQPKPDTERPWRAALGPLGTPRRFGPLLLLLLATVIYQLAAPDTDWTQFIAILLLAGTLLLTLWTTDAVGDGRERATAGDRGRARKEEFAILTESSQPEPDAADRSARS